MDGGRAFHRHFAAGRLRLVADGLGRRRRRKQQGRGDGDHRDSWPVGSVVGCFHSSGGRCLEASAIQGWVGRMPWGLRGGWFLFLGRNVKTENPWARLWESQVLGMAFDGRAPWQ